MKRISLFVICGLVAVFLTSLSFRHAEARSQYKKKFEAIYKDNTNLMGAVKQTKCNTCHYGKKKTNRNDFGTALSKFLNKEKYEKLKKNKAALEKEFEAALQAVLNEKSVSGKPFGALIEEGKSPGTPPPGEEATGGEDSEDDDDEK